MTRESRPMAAAEPEDDGRDRQLLGISTRRLIAAVGRSAVTDVGGRDPTLARLRVPGTVVAVAAVGAYSWFTQGSIDIGCVRPLLVNEPGSQPRLWLQV
jgi:hypothetical protein